jgi:hypothetical protein
MIFLYACRRRRESDEIWDSDAGISASRILST